jgi:hypothetical protein
MMTVRKRVIVGPWDKILLNMTEASELSGLSIQTLHSLIKMPDSKMGIKVKGVQYIKRKVLEEYLLENELIE